MVRNPQFLMVFGILAIPVSNPLARGATVPWISYEAEEGLTREGARVVGPGRALGTPQGEASGRRAVILDQTGASIEWAATADANTIVVRNSIPDAPGGGGLSATLSLYINGVKRAALNLSSAHSWVYGDDGTQTDNPGNGPPRKIYDEAQLRFSGFSIAPGDIVQLRKDAGDAATSYAIDFIDLEQIGAALPMPAGYVSITDGSQGWAPAIADDANADDNAINQCISAAQAGRFAGVYIPPGTFIQNNKFQTQKVKIQGAGMWYSKFHCPNRQEDAGWGQTGFNINGDSSQFRDFAIFGWGGTRNQGGKAFVNSARRGTVIERLWFESVQCGYWVGGSQESTDLLIRDCRFRNTGADAVNLCNGNLRGVIDNCHARNTGDDAFAIWSARDLYALPCVNNVIRNSTVQITWRAACFAIYGGTGNRIENCLGADALTYPGLTVSTEFAPYPLVSAIVDGLTLLRCGATYWDVNQQFGAIWLYSSDAAFSGVTIRNVDIIDPTYQGIHIQSRNGYAISNTLFENIAITNPTTYGIQAKAGALGTATLRNVASNGTPSVPRLVNQSSGFTFVDENVPTPISEFTKRKNTTLEKDRVLRVRADGRKLRLGLGSGPEKYSSALGGVFPIHRD